MTNLNPELVEKKEPPIITSIKNIKVKFWSDFRAKPMLDILLVIDNKFIRKSFLELKKRKKIPTITTR